MMPNLTPGYVIDGNFLVIAPSKDALKSAVDAHQKNDGLAASDSLKSLAPRVTASGNVFQFMDFGNAFATAEVFLKKMPNGEEIQPFLTAAKVLKSGAGSSLVKDGAVISEGVLTLN